MLINNDNFLIKEIPKYHPKSTEYRLFWKEQKKRCLEGYTVGGKYMPGRLYAYINFGTIELLNEDTGRKTRGRPLLRDIEWEFFGSIEECRLQKKGLLWIAGRRAGKSFEGGFLPSYEYTFFPDNEMVVSAHESRYSNPLMEKIRLHLDGLIGTPFYHQRIKDDLNTELRSGYQVRTSLGFERRGYNSRIYNIKFKDDHTAANGKAASVFVFEEIGMFDNLDMAYNSSEPCWKEGTNWYGMPVLFGTGGDMEKGSIAAQKMFYDPETYNLLVFKDSNNTDQCMFTPGWKCLNEYKRVFGIEEGGDGITLVTMEEEAKAATDAIKARKKTSVNKDSYYQELQYYPDNPAHAFLQSGGNRFNIPLLEEQKNYLLTDIEARNKGERGYMEKGRDGLVKFVQDEEAEEAPFPFHAEKRYGCVTIYEHPESINGDIPFGLYLASNDPYRVDETKTSDSLGSTFIFKRFYHPSKTFDWLVAEYTGRPESTTQYDEQVRLLCLYYNSRLMFENEVAGIRVHFQQQHSGYMLCDEPKAIIRSISPGSEVSRSKGCHASAPIKLQAERWLADWLVKIRDPETGFRNLHYIYSVNLINELINYNPAKGNYDRVSSMFMMMIHMKMMEEIAVAGEDEEDTSVSPFASLDRRWGWDKSKDALLGQYTNHIN